METRITQPFADGDYDFWLPMTRVVAAEREIDGSILALFYGLADSLAKGVGGAIVLAGATDARLKSCHSIIRNALIGGGTGEQEARELVETYCYPARPAMHDVALTWEILNAAVYGIQIPDGSKKKDEAPDAPPHS